MKAIYLPALQQHVSIRAYVEAVKLAKANPDALFKHGLDSWWPTKGAEIVRQWWRTAVDRMNAQRPFVERR